MAAWVTGSRAAPHRGCVGRHLANRNESRVSGSDSYASLFLCRLLNIYATVYDRCTASPWRSIADRRRLISSTTPQDDGLCRYEYDGYGPRLELIYYGRHPVNFSVIYSPPRHQLSRRRYYMQPSLCNCVICIFGFVVPIQWLICKKINVGTLPGSSPLICPFHLFSQRLPPLFLSIHVASLSSSPFTFPRVSKFCME